VVEVQVGCLRAAGGLAVTLVVLFTISRRRYRAVPRIPPLDGAAGSKLPDCMVVIPARNEETTIGRAVRSFPPDTVIVVDDDSEDGTAEAARQAGAGVLHAPKLLRNGIGKANACAAGARALTSRWVLFTDADTWFEPGFIEAVVAYAEAGELSLLSIHLDPEYRGLAEHTLGPYARALALCGVGAVNSPRALFTGQCLLARLVSYSFIGGHSAGAIYLTEDIKLAMLAERHRLKFATARAQGMGRARMYEGYAGLRSGLERQAFRFMMVNPTIGVVNLCVALLAALWLPVLVWLIWRHQWMAAAFFALVPTLLLRPWYKSWARALLAPMAVYWILPSLGAGLFSALFGRPVQWKGRTVRAVS
jgi:cellulose synthase/poly-beta-1,6-N-acetylglucosamine synthase-like glycosyltransferase